MPRSSQANEVIRRAPDIIIGSWCGKRFRPERVKAREGWDSIPAVRTGHIHEIKSADILQPGPAALARRRAGPDPPHHRALGRGD
jgi:iron complex transport system substrate-binding protein